jgi:Rrf2 family protein
MLSQAAEYSLRAVCCLADHAGRSLTIRQIADLTSAPTGYLAKVLSLLSRAGIVAAQRGVNGGYVMVKPASEVTLLDVVKVADPSHRLLGCPLGITSHCGGNLCSLHRRVDAAAAAAEAVFAGSTIAQVLADDSGSHPLRGLPVQIGLINGNAHA